MTLELALATPTLLLVGLPVANARADQRQALRARKHRMPINDSWIGRPRSCTGSR